MAVMLLVLVMLGWVLGLGCEGVDVRIDPPHLHVPEKTTLINVSCRADAPLTGCQFSWLDSKLHRARAGPVLDLSLGLKSQADPAHLKQLSSYAYHGRGLSAGECGVQLEVQGYKQWLIACRVKTGGNWVYNWTTLFAHNYDPIPHTILTRSVVALERGQAVVKVKTKGRLSRCRFNLPDGLEVDLSEGRASPKSTGRHLYQGTGIDQGECGLALTNLSENENGPVRVVIDTSNSDEEWRLIPLIVARPPTSPKMNVTYNKSVVTATCSVQESRPLADITWMLGVDVVRQDNEDDSPGRKDDEWRWPWDKGFITQTITYLLQLQDMGKELKCSVSHVALTKPLEASAVIAFRGLPPCLPLSSETVQISCSFEESVTDCGRKQRPGTVANLKCKPRYFLPHIYGVITCLESGQWSRPLFNCLPSDCGRRRTSSVVAFISGGETANFGEFPWHVGIYRASQGSYVQVCGGSLIKPNVVLSAAHCFWDNGLKQKTDVSHYRVAAGKSIRAWEDHTPMVQKREVLSVNTNLYNGLYRNFGYDIALVFLKDPVKITDNVNLVCVDWDNVGLLQRLRADRTGVVPGWGLTEHGEVSDDLKYLELPYVPKATCFEALAELEQPYLTNDKFCAGFRNENKSVCKGDSGGGLVFLDQSTSRYFIRGVASTNFRPASQSALKGKCNSTLYTTFTDVSVHVAWMRGDE